MFECIINLRHELHRLAELSGQEVKTAGCLYEFLRQQKPDQLQTGIAGNGLVASFEGPDAGPSVLLRADLDALPIDETIALPHQSHTKAVAHKCGHDGHMAILCGVARELAINRLTRGRVVLLFQPAEEKGWGAARVLADPAFARLNFDWVFALHNLPGYPLGQVVVREGVFATPSIGLELILSGTSAHAAEPDRGRSPVLAAAELIQRLSALPKTELPPHTTAQITITHVRVGERDFGTTPGLGCVFATLRASDESTLKTLTVKAEHIAHDIAAVRGIECRIKQREPFPATMNSSEAIRRVRHAAKGAGLSVQQLHHPFGWSEDFGHFTTLFRGALIGLGAGENVPALHHPSYDFPDELLAPAISLWLELIQLR